MITEQEAKKIKIKHNNLNPRKRKRQAAQSTANSTTKTNRKVTKKSPTANKPNKSGLNSNRNKPSPKNQDINLRNLILEQLTNEIQKFQIAHNCVLVFMDINEPIHTPEIQQFIQVNNLIAFTTACHTKQIMPPTYKDGSDQIDIVMGSPIIFDALENIGLLPENEVFESDHLCFYLDFNTNQLFGKTYNLPPRIQQRRLLSTNKYHR